MLTWMLNRWLDGFEREYRYDASYMREVLAADPVALLKFALGSLYSRHRVPELPVAAFSAAALASALHEDCGPCAQLGIAMAERAGVPTADLRALVRGDPHGAGDDASLGFRFARSILRREDEEADGLREDVRRRWGERALVSLGLALTGVRAFPTLKRALGHARECRRLTVAGEMVQVAHVPEPLAA